MSAVRGKTRPRTAGAKSVTGKKGSPNTARGKAASRPAELESLAQLRGDPQNPREIDAEALTALTASLGTFGDLSGIVWNRRTGLLVTGHQRLAGLREQYGARLRFQAGAVMAPGGQRFPVRVVDWNDEQAKAAMVAANSELLQGRWTGDLDVALARARAGVGEDAFLELRLDELRAELEDGDVGGGLDLDKIPELPRKPKTKPGDLWQLGDHRILCGDATSAKDVGRLMSTELADLVFTDPPYGVSYESARHGCVRGDEQRDDELAQFLAGAFKQLVGVTTSDAAFYVWHAAPTRRDFEFALAAAGLEEKQTIIWVKEGFVLGRADYHHQFEPCFYCQKCGHSATWYGDRTESTAWRLGRLPRPATGAAISLANGLRVATGEGTELYLAPRAPRNKRLRLLRLAEGESVELAAGSALADAWQISREATRQYVHPTQKPVELAERAIVNSSSPAGIVLDSFLGSGTTLIAAEQAGRRCRGLELEPKYCDVIIERWEEVSAGKAKRQRR